MALPNKSRNNRRQSSTSYTSTLTTLVFIALCVLGVWMLTSNSVVSPKTTERTSTYDNSVVTTNDFSSKEDTTEDSPAETNTKSQNQNQNQQESQSYGDNPGHLPDEAMNKGGDDDQPKQEDSVTNDQKMSEPEKDEQSSISTDENQNVEEKQNTELSQNENSGGENQEQQDVQSFDTHEGSKTNEDEQNGQQLREDKGEVTEGYQKNEEQNVEAKQNTESSQKANAGENQEQKTQDVQSLDTSEGSKTYEDEENQQQLREDKGENTENDHQKQKEDNQNVQDESHEETEKHKPKEKRRISDKSSKKEDHKKEWSTQADESQGEKERQKDESSGGGSEKVHDLEWHLCNVTAGADFIPCLDNEKYLKHSARKHYEHRERHCPEDAPTCLVPVPKGYKTRIQWPNSRDKIWYHNVPHIKLAEVKGHQNWVKLTGEFLTFPGGGTQFIHGALHYIDFLQEAEAGIAWGKHTRVILDVGCGVGSFGGYLFERDVIAVSFAPKDEHEAQVQFALERGIPAISAVMGTQRLQFPARVFDLVHCARCRVPWHEDGGLLLLELNRVLRPGGYFVWSATPVYQKLEEDVQIWSQMSSLTKAMCWELVTIKKDALNQVGAAFFRKPTSNECYEQREQNQPPMCKDDDDPNAAWYVPLQACMHKLPVDKAERGTRWPEVWPPRLHKAPYWLNNSQDFAADDERWKNVVDELNNIGVTWSNVRNIMDMKALYGGFAAALKDLPVWVFNVVSTDSQDTLPIIFERGLIGMYHDWCESFSTYPRTYDLLHADGLFSKLKNRCNLVPVIAEVDRIVRPGGTLIVRDESSAISEVENLLRSLHWEITTTNQEGVICSKKGTWRPNTYVSLF